MSGRSVIPHMAVGKHKGEILAAYLVITAQINDRERFISGYAAAAAQLTARFGGEYLVRSPGLEVLEGAHPGGSLVISKWPDKAAALAFWNSPEYQQVKKLRQGIADCQVLLVEEPPAANEGGGTNAQAHNVVKRTTLIVRDMQASKRWYEQVLGMRVWMDTEFVLSGQDLAAGQAGDRTRLVIMRAEHPSIGMIGLLQWLDPPWPAPPPAAEVAYGMPIFVVRSDDAALVAKRATELGGRLFSPPREWSTRGAEGELRHFIGASVFDPDGHFFECNQVIRIDPPEEA